MRNRTFPQVLFAASALLFAACSALQFTAGDPALGFVFGVIAVVGIALFILIRTGRITW